MAFSRIAFKPIAAGFVAAGTLFIAASANASTSWSVGVNVPGVVSEAAPDYYGAAPVYSRPAPTYYQPAQQVYSVPAPVYYEPRSRWEERRAERREWRRRQWEREQYRRYYEDRD